MTLGLARRARLVGPLLALALLAAGCQAVGPRATLGLQAASGARLTLRLRPAAPYALAYVEARDWEQAVVTLSSGGNPVDEQTGQAARQADGSRSATVAFAGLTPGTVYAVQVRLLGRDAAGQATELGTLSQDTPALASGANDLTLADAPTWGRSTAAPAGEATGFVGATIASFPAAGPGARLRAPGGVAQAVDGTIYVADTGNHRILQVDPDGTTSVLAGGVAGFADGNETVARFREPGVLALAGNDLFVCDTGNHAVRRIRLGGDTRALVTTWAGDGTAGDNDGGGPFNPPARLRSPAGLAWDEARQTLYVADTGNHRIKALVQDGEPVFTRTLAGDGTAGHVDGHNLQAVRFSAPSGLYLHADRLFIADTNNHVLRALTVDPTATPDLITSAGSPGQPGHVNGSGATARLTKPSALTGDGTTIYVADVGNHRVRTLDVAPGSYSLTIADYAGSGVRAYADGPLAQAAIPGDFALAFDPQRGLLLADVGGHRVRQIGPDQAQLTAIVGDGVAGDLGGRAYRGSAVAAGRAAFFTDGDALVSDQADHRLVRIGADGSPTVFSGSATEPASGYAEGPAATARFDGPMGLVADGAGGFFLADANNHVIRHVGADGATELLAGLPGAPGGLDGTGDQARFKRPWALAYDATGGFLYVAERGGNRVRRLQAGLSGWTVETLVGSPDGVGGSADGAGGVAGPARLAAPVGLALAADGTLYVADADNHRIRALATGQNGTPMLSTVAGSGDASSLDGPALAASFLDLADLAVAADGAVWAVDGHRLRRLDLRGDPGATVTSVAGFTVPGYADGPGELARFDAPLGLTRGPDGRLWVCDTGNGWLRVVRD